MNCSDLDRYLEALLEQRLGRSRQAVMRRHVESCVNCQTRIQRLTQFERDLHRRFRSMETLERVWHSLELEAVRGAETAAPKGDSGKSVMALPAPKAVAGRAPHKLDLTANPGVASRGQRRLALVQTADDQSLPSVSLVQRILGVAIIALAFSALINFVTGHLVPAAGQIPSIPTT
ncbi:MAG: hypothetical protein AAFY56_06515 [Pseudomonadota bacterium]